MPFHRFSALLLALVLCLLPGCGERPISSRLVLSSMGVECSARPLTAVLEVIREEKNETITVQGESFTALFSAAERQTGSRSTLARCKASSFPACPMAARCGSISVRCWPMEGFPPIPRSPCAGTPFHCMMEKRSLGIASPPC